jgi:hypothetical protein
MNIERNIDKSLFFFIKLLCMLIQVLLSLAYPVGFLLGVVTRQQVHEVVGSVSGLFRLLATHRFIVRRNPSTARVVGSQVACDAGGCTIYVFLKVFGLLLDSYFLFLHFLVLRCRNDLIIWLLDAHIHYRVLDQGGVIGP